MFGHEFVDAFNLSKIQISSFDVKVTGIVRCNPRGACWTVPRAYFSGKYLSLYTLRVFPVPLSEHFEASQFCD